MPGTDLLGQEEKNEILEVMETGCFFRYNHEHIRQDRWKAKEFEQEAKHFLNAPFAHIVSSGSTAVTTALAAAGVGFGDEVIVPPFTYIASIEAVLWQGALPVFAEIDETLCLSADGIEKVISSKTKAVLLVHMCGAAADMDAILQVCKKHNLILVEDAGQALGASYKNKYVGLFGKTGAYSLDFFKIITAGEGGLCVTEDKNMYDIMQQLSDHGHNHIGDNRGMELHPILGINFRISELHAAIALAQIRKLKKIIGLKKRNKAILKNKLQKLSSISFRYMPDEDGDSGTFLNFFLPDKDKAQQAMKQFNDDGLAGFNYWFTNMYHFINQWDHLKDLKMPFKLAIHHLGAPQDYHNLDIPQTQNIIGRLISLGIKANWTEQQTEEFGDKMLASLSKLL